MEHMLSVVGKCTLITGSRLKVPEQQDHMGRRRYITATFAVLQSVDTTSLRSEGYYIILSAAGLANRVQIYIFITL